MWKMFAYKLALNFPRCAIAKAAWIPTYDTLYYVRVYGTNGDSTQRRRKDDKTSCFGHGQSQRCTQKCPLIWSRWTLQPYCGRALIDLKDFFELVKKWLINWGKIPIFWFCNKWFNVDCNTFLLWRNVNHCKSNNSFAKFWVHNSVWTANSTFGETRKFFVVYDLNIRFIASVSWCNFQAKNIKYESIFLNVKQKIANGSYDDFARN